MSNKSNHTPTPWIWQKARTQQHLYSLTRKDTVGQISMPIIGTQGYRGYPVKAQDEYEANAAFIVRAVNNHDSIMEALESVLNDSDVLGHSEYSPQTANKIRDAISKARGES